jgi:hypothetical protein
MFHLPPFSLIDDGTRGNASEPFVGSTDRTVFWSFVHRTNDLFILQALLINAAAHHGFAIDRPALVGGQSADPRRSTPPSGLPIEKCFGGLSAFKARALRLRLPH